MIILKVSPNRVKKIMEKVRKFIEEGKVIVCPTDTVYGLLGDATNKKVVKNIFKIKKRSTKNPIPIFIKDIKMAKKIAKIDKSQEKFLKRVWPGKVTAVLKPKRKFPQGIVCEKGKIALRIPNYKLVNMLLEKLNHPLTGTSANISGKPASTKIKEVLRQFQTKALDTKFDKHQPDLILDAGNLPKTRPSVILDLTSFPPKILRY